MDGYVPWLLNQWNWLRYFLLLSEVQNGRKYERWRQVLVMHGLLVVFDLSLWPVL